MRFDDVLENMDSLLGKQITVSGWLVDASNRGLGKLFYLAVDRSTTEDTSRAILVANMLTSDHDPATEQITAAAAFIATYGRLSPIEARVTGVLEEEYDSIFLLGFKNIKDITVTVSRWGYSGYYRVDGISDEELGLTQLPALTTTDVLVDGSTHADKDIILSGIITGQDILSGGSEILYVVAQEHLVKHPGLSPLATVDMTAEEMAVAEKDYHEKRERYENDLLAEQKNAVRIRYKGILRKIIAPNYGRRTFSAQIRIIGRLQPAQNGPFKWELDQVRALIIYGENAVQVWDLTQFPYGQNC